MQRGDRAKATWRSPQPRNPLDTGETRLGEGTLAARQADSDEFDVVRQGRCPRREKGGTSARMMETE
jgi:hypothetical protein